jgi:hypothetical protein
VDAPYKRQLDCRTCLGDSGEAGSWSYWAVNSIARYRPRPGEVGIGNISPILLSRLAAQQQNTHSGWFIDSATAFNHWNHLSAHSWSPGRCRGLWGDFVPGGREGWPEPPKTLGGRAMPTLMPAMQSGTVLCIEPSRNRLDPVLAGANERMGARQFLKQPQ